MQPLLYVINIGTLAAWLSVSSASTVALVIKKHERLPELKTHEVQEISITEGELQEVDTFSGGSAPTQELDAENNEEVLQQQEAATEVVPEIPEMPELADNEPLPEVPDLPEAKPEPAPSPDSVSVPKPKPLVAKPSSRHGPQAKSGSDRPVARRTESGNGNGSGSGMNKGAGSGDTGAARFSGGRTPKPGYPANARKQGVQGVVRVSLTVDETGCVVSCSITSASNPVLNDSSILSTVNRWKFRPGPRATRVVPINFTLH